MWKCPSCKSENIQKLSLLVESGTRKFSGATIGGSIGTGGNALGIGMTGGTLKSELASKLGPPEKPTLTKKHIELYRLLAFPSIIIIPFGVAIIAFIFNDYSSGIVMLFIGIGLTYYLYSKVIPRLDLQLYVKNDEFIKKQAMYNNSFCCLRCGETFEMK